MHRHLATPLTTLKSRSVSRLTNHSRLFVSSARVCELAHSKKDTKDSKPRTGPPLQSSCPENTVLEGLNYLKGQEPVLAKKDEDYPSWLWTILKPKPIPDDGPGGKGEKMRLQAANKQRIREQNFLKTQ